MWHRNHKILMIGSIVAGLILAACGGGTTAPPSGGATTAPAAGEATTAPAAEGGGVTIRYGLWDSAQQPSYQACADEFHKQNPNITVKIEQLGWNDYWSGLQTGMVGGTAPDVFTDHLAKFSEFAAKNQLVDIQPLVDKDKVDVKQYLPGTRRR